MSAQGLKAEPTIENKRERRRGPAGRAAALRRAPSDSDCSGETASLSADSGERRAPPPPPRSGKTRNRRRGSEWEVLEGLKDGQRFERRPDVFNGYLHKKRKWPLKGWHKRFFVVDGGILVYARSPTDVARGRLHGSLDVGLSVISAKPRRRRIDIDADEFIYHLRAKTPEVFRTWLNVLKAHRLYRQHLLTFGARESVPKIHAPLEELPPTEASSRISQSSRESFSTITSTTVSSPVQDLTGSPTFQFPSSMIQPSVYENVPKNILKNWALKNSSGLLPLKLEPINVDNFEVKYKNPGNTGSLCSMCCVGRKIQNNADIPKSPIPINLEQETNLTSVNLRMAKSPDESSSPVQDSLLLGECVLNSPMDNTNPPAAKKQPRNPCLQLFHRDNSRFNRKPQTAMFILKHGKRTSIDDQWAMKRSRKSTNVYKYRNCSEEPVLSRPLSRCLLLGKYMTDLDDSPEDSKQTANRGIACDMTPKGDAPQQDKCIQDTLTTSEYDHITEKIILTLFEHREKNIFKKENTNVQFYVNEAVKELYNVSLYKSDTNPIPCLFKTLLEFWLNNTQSDKLKNTLRRNAGVERQSNKYFMKDAEISSEAVKSATKQTQVFATSDEILNWEKLYNCKKHKPARSPPKPLPRTETGSSAKERRIQELERLLKNTVYVCETVRSTKSKEKDIKITKTLIRNLDKLGEKTPKKAAVTRDGSDDNREISDPSAEIPKIQDTLNHLISDTDIPPEVAKEFLNVYLDVLLHSDSQTYTTSSQSSDASVVQQVGYGSPTGDVQTECVQKKISKSVTTTYDKINKPSFDGDDHVKNESVDPGQLYLKEMLDKITSMFSRVRKIDSKAPNDDKDKHDEKKEKLKSNSTDKRRNRDLIYENKQDKSVVIDLAKYDLENISMVNEATSTGKVAITIKLKEKAADFGEYKRKNLNLKFSKEHPQKVHVNRLVPWPAQLNTPVLKPQINSIVDMKNPKICNDPSFPKNKMELKACLSTSDATSKANRHTLHEADSFDFSRTSNVSPHLSEKSLNVADDAQCYLLSSFKKIVLETNVPDKKKIRLRELNGVLKSRAGLPELTPRRPDDVIAFEKPTPRIIDEKFILLLLENLTLLSKNLPGIHKDINHLYLKLRKRHQRLSKNASLTPGLSLLGKIYNSESVTNLHRITIDSETQYENTVDGDGGEQAAQIAANTSGLMSSPKVLDISLKTLEHLEDQTEVDYKNKQNNKENSVNPKSGREAQTSSSWNIRNLNERPMTDRSVSIQNWYKKLTQDGSMRALKCLYEKMEWQKKNVTPDAEVKIPDKEIVVTKKSQRKVSSKVRQDLIKEISLLSSFKSSSQAQTDRKNIRHWNCLQKNFKVFQLLPYDTGFLARSGSVTGSSVKVDGRERSDDLKTLYRCTSVPSFCSGLISPTAPPLRGPQAGFVAGTPGGRLASWIIESGGPLESASRELGQAQLSVQHLQRLLDALEHHDTDISLEGASPNVKKDRRKFGLRKKKSNSKCASVELAPPHVDASNSHMALSALTAPPSPGGGAVSMPNSAASLPIACAAARPQSLPGAEALGAGGPASLASLTPDHQLREDFNVLAKDLVASLKTIVSTLVCERGRLRAAMEATEATPPGGVVASLRTNLSSALQQNSELRSRLSRIHDASDLAEVSSVGNNSDPQAARPFPQSLSYSSSCVSASEFFDAEEHDDEFKPAEIITTDEEHTLQAGVIELDGDSSSEAGSLSSEEGSASSDNSDGATSAAMPAERHAGADGRRARLPCPRPTPASPSLWNLLYKNIGKDLSQISMPVTINEPLNMLQRLCEELEYSELLDSAAACAEPVERMALLAAFAVSAYAASAHRAASKPFNPLLAETYECVRADRDFRFIAEQVSHHPPISACHAESPRWTFWQEARIKTKFWGKSMEFQPTGRVHVRLTGSGDHYSWNKVTTCVHNLFGGQRWVDQYGDMHIVCHGTDITCKLNFIKASSWSSGRHEVRGAVLAGGAPGLRLAGRWSEGLQAGERPLWRPRPMPPDFELYYGFTRFAMELNELEPGMREILPSTDTRLRPDQRALEEGDVEAAEQFKHELEQAQRERRRDGLEHRPLWFRKTVVDGEETWVFPGEYWKAREAGFADTPRLW